MIIQRVLPTLPGIIAPLDASACYEDRVDAGRRLARQLLSYRGSRALALALPPGGVVVAGELARALRLQLDVLVARELFVQAYPSIAVGALSEGGGLCLNRAALRLPGMSLAAVWREARRTGKEIATLVAAYRHERYLPLLYRRTVILVDDGLGSGLMQLAALQALRRAHAQHVVVATTGGAADAIERVGRRADALVALDHDGAEHDSAWPQTPDDDEAAALLASWRLRRPAH